MPYLTTTYSRSRLAEITRTLNIIMLKLDPRVVGSNLHRFNWLFFFFMWNMGKVLVSRWKKKSHSLARVNFLRIMLWNIHSKACSCKFLALQLQPRFFFTFFILFRLTKRNYWHFIRKKSEVFRKCLIEFLKIPNLRMQF
jgi:hypothetical protein